MIAGLEFLEIVTPPTAKINHQRAGKAGGNREHGHPADAEQHASGQNEHGKHADGSDLDGLAMEITQADFPEDRTQGDVDSQKRTLPRKREGDAE